MSDSRSPPRRPSAPTPALDALVGGPAGGPIRRALWLDGLDRRFRPHLPPSLAAHTRLANVEGGKLVFVVDAPVWGAKLRLASLELLELARSFGLDAQHLVVKTAPAPPPAPPAQRPPLPMSEHAREALRSALASLDVPPTAPKPGRRR
ncbi:DciA family protein [Cognatilysobacter bugurensis]|uniref:DciA family protein n=1 Tax=Cognatilysobacter bugurensis TaxID=543356 RepID=UPI0016783563|nr:DciA family protein [Lysobacter bugurensis]